MAAKALNLKFCKVALLEQPNFQSGPFRKSRFYRTARSGNSDFIEQPVLGNPILENGLFWKILASLPP